MKLTFKENFFSNLSDTKRSNYSSPRSKIKKEETFNLVHWFPLIFLVLVGMWFYFWKLNSTRSKPSFY